MIDVARHLLLAATDDDVGSLIKVLLFLGIVVISVINSAIKKAKETIANRPPPAAVEGDAGMRSQVLDRARLADESSTHPPLRPNAPARPPGSMPVTAIGPTGTDAPPARRRGFVDDAHGEGSALLPTENDLSGAHVAGDRVHLTEIGAERRTAHEQPRAHPQAAATVARRTGVSGHTLLRSSDLRGRDRVRAGILWAEVFGAPRSRKRR